MNKHLGLTVVVCAAVGLCACGKKAVQDGCSVKMVYELKVEGQTIEKNDASKPFQYVQGRKEIIPGLEKALAGKKQGEKLSVHIEAPDAYGVVRPELMREVPIANLPKDKAPQPGMVLQSSTPDGRPLFALIKEVKKTTVLLDFNHPLAGKALDYSIEVGEVDCSKK